mmetsp:Transcript_4395/g.6543  ORF Transcript_4395/g.6543 Transcript_4395/m.6543 type:complete len:96 (+) Transcript_4395:1850-2137(+)
MDAEGNQRVLAHHLFAIGTGHVIVAQRKRSVWHSVKSIAGGGLGHVKPALMDTNCRLVLWNVSNGKRSSHARRPPEKFARSGCWTFRTLASLKNQ